MSDYQFGEYAKVRKVELEKEKSQTVKRMQNQQNQELFQMASSSCILSRLV